MGRGFGVDAGLPAEVASELARRAEAAGYTSIWTTDTPRADGLADLAAFASGTTRIRLGVGVLPLDRRPPAAIVEQVRALGLPLDRLWLGIGSGASDRPLALVREAIPPLREALPGVAIAVAAMGPRMTRLAADLAEGVHLNWLTPNTIENARSLAGSASRAQLLMYVRAALDPGGRERVGQEAARYAATRSAHFEANGVPVDQVGVAGPPGSFDAQLAPYEALLDQTIVRALPASPAPEDLFALLEATRPPG
ncbi:MAG: LLM class flavin-dependent oxidoreductase [Dehalococcoidia bacterium]|nr:LLM class flavin-dependent oxidoreductase [Dehalococcoidia bacterium]